MTSTDRIRRPGFGLPLNYLPAWSKKGEKDRFPHPIADQYRSSGITLRERRMLNTINQISDKNDWEHKIFDESIVEKWKLEACAYGDKIHGDVLSEKMFDYCIAELREKSKISKDRGFIHVLDAEATVVKSDTQVEDSLREALIRAVRSLEDVPERLKDWHPGSNEMVLDLLHPSLFPIVLGRSRALPDRLISLDGCLRTIGLGEVIPPNQLSETDRNIQWQDEIDKLQAWGNYQWLPSEIRFEDDRPKFDSYVNNLHPVRHQELYGVLEQFVDRCIPMWNECLSWFHDRIRIHPNCNDEDWFIPEGRHYPRPTELDELFTCEGGENCAEDHDAMTDEEWVQHWHYEDEYEEWKQEVRELEEPEPDEFEPWTSRLDRPGAYPVDLRADFKDSGLQVIFKLANIHLTPEKPEYEGGTWHVEGALNEHIVASAIYYYDEENIGKSRLAFRQPWDEGAMMRKAPQWEHESTEQFYNVPDETQGALLQELGSVLTDQGRLVTFPNVLHHQVQSFRLTDPTKSGHRKILAMFLVDPHIRILSTANVPPQRQDWWMEQIRSIKPFSKLPEEIFQTIIALVDFPISWEDALDIRKDLMTERKGFTDGLNEQMADVSLLDLK